MSKTYYRYNRENGLLSLHEREGSMYFLDTDTGARLIRLRNLGRVPVDKCTELSKGVYDALTKSLLRVNELLGYLERTGGNDDPLLKAAIDMYRDLKSQTSGKAAIEKITRETDRLIGAHYVVPAAPAPRSEVSLQQLKGALTPFFVLADNAAVLGDKAYAKELDNFVSTVVNSAFEKQDPGKELAYLSEKVETWESKLKSRASCSKLEIHKDLATHRLSRQSIHESRRPRGRVSDMTTAARLKTLAIIDKAVQEVEVSGAVEPHHLHLLPKWFAERLERSAEESVSAIYREIDIAHREVHRHEERKRWAEHSRESLRTQAHT